MARNRRSMDPRWVLNKGNGKFPPCFESYAQYTDWRMFMRASLESMRVGICHDCTPEYKMEMMCQNRCQHPETVFVTRTQRTGEMEMIGVAEGSLYWNSVQDGKLVLMEQDDDEDKQPSEREDG